MTFFWQNPVASVPKPGQVIELRVGWPENGRGKEVWTKCKVYQDAPGEELRCTTVPGEDDRSLTDTPRWKKGDEKKSGRRWRPT